LNRLIDYIKENEKILLISIKPTFSKLILSKKKTVELRKKLPKISVKYAIIYESSPTKKITGIIKIRKIYMRSVETIIRYSKKASVDKEFIKKYYEDHELGVVIDIEKASKLNKQIPIQAIKKCGINVPQDYMYVGKEQIANLLGNTHGS